MNLVPRGVTMGRGRGGGMGDDSQYSPHAQTRKNKGNYYKYDTKQNWYRGKRSYKYGIDYNSNLNHHNYNTIHHSYPDKRYDKSKKKKLVHSLPCNRIRDGNHKYYHHQWGGEKNI